MKIKLHSITTEESEVTEGFKDEDRVRWASEVTYEFLKPDQTSLTVYGFYWDWGNLYTLPQVSAPDFANWIAQQDYSEEEISKLSDNSLYHPQYHRYQWLAEQINNFLEAQGGTNED